MGSDWSRWGPIGSDVVRLGPMGSGWVISHTQILWVQFLYMDMCSLCSDISGCSCSGTLCSKKVTPKFKSAAAVPTLCGSVSGPPVVPLPSDLTVANVRRLVDAMDSYSLAH